MRKSVLTGIVFALVLTAGAHGGIVYDSTAGLQMGDIYSTNVLDDCVLSGGGPVTIQAMHFGFENVDAVSERVDAIISFWDSVNVAATNTEIVNTVLLGTFRHPLGLVAGGSVQTTGLFNLPSAIGVADGSLGVQVFIVQEGTETQANYVYPLMTIGDAPVVGSTSDAYWSDTDQDGTPFLGWDKVGAGTPGAYANLYLQLSDVPEPATLSLLAFCGLGMLARRRHR